MKVLVITKPVYDYILPLVEFPSDGDIFNIENSIKTISSIGSIVSVTLAKYNLEVYLTGTIGYDDTGKKIKEILSNNKVNVDYIENTDGNTCTSYKIYNSKSNKFTCINEKSLKGDLTKYKYDIEPEVIIMDDKDYQANLAAINNYPNSTLIYIGEKYTKESSIYCNKCNYVISNLSFASEATGITNLKKEKNYVELFQKFIDLYNTNLIIKLDNFDILYCINDEVRLIKNINKNITNKDYIYYSVLVYNLINNKNIEDSIKLTNKIMLNSNNDINLLNDIPEYNVVNEIIKNYNNTLINNAIDSNTKLTDNKNSIEEKTITETNLVKNAVETLETPNLNENNGVNNVERL
ncbi:MAG: hypothetical protein IJD92_04090 [Bacilli bacterium]|nr:hypothetical protein [Bacilli bacterium]